MVLIFSFPTVGEEIKKEFYEVISLGISAMEKERRQEDEKIGAYGTGSQMQFIFFVSNIKE